MALVSRVNGNIGSTTEVDSYSLNLTAGTHYSFDITGQTAKNSAFTLGNPVIKVYAPDGTLVGQQDYTTVSTGMGSGASLLSMDPHFAFTAGSSGQYTVTVESGQIADIAYDWGTYLPNSGQTLNNLNATGTYQLELNSYTNTELVDPVIGNYRWMDHAGDARGTGATIYYDFATNNLGSSTTTATNPAYGWYNIEGFNEADQAKIEGWLAEFESVANINFVRADGSHPATMHFMQGKSADGASTGTAWLYGTDGYQFNAGDYGTDKQLGRVDLLIDTDSWAIDGINSGSAYSLFMHEMGHALGLKHPGNYTPGDISNRVEHASYDNSSWSVLSYNDNFQQVSPNEGAALKALDIAALQSIYGANPNSSGGNTTWNFNDTHAEYSTTIHDTGGSDTLDASGQNIGSVINLQPGSLSSIGNVSAPPGMESVLAQYTVDGVFGDKAYNNIGISFDTLIENAKGGNGDDYIVGNLLNNTLSGNGGNDHLDGGDGLDTAVYSGSSDQYTINLAAHTVTDQVGGRDGSDSLANVERLSFSDTAVGLDNGFFETAGAAYRLYKAAFDRAPDTGGLGYWINYLDHGADIAQNVAFNFIISDEFQSNYGPQLSNNEFITLIYNHVLDRDPDAGGLAYWNDQMDNHGMARANLLVNFSESAENMSNTADLIVNGVKFDIYTG